MIDAPRPGVPEAVLKCHPATAQANVSKVNIIREGSKVLQFLKPDITDVQGIDS